VTLVFLVSLVLLDPRVQLVTRVLRETRVQLAHLVLLVNVV